MDWTSDNQNSNHLSTKTIARRRYGVIDVQDQINISIRFRRYPKLASLLGANWDRMKKRWHRPGSNFDRVRLFYNQPLFHSKYLALAYFVSDHRASLTTIAVSLSVLDYVAMVKKSDAIVSEITNPKIKDRHLEFFGWEPHMPASKKRNWIKRFYGNYPDTFMFQSLQNKPGNKTTDNELTPV